MKRTVMRCRANHSGQAWPGQAIGAVSPRGLLQKFFQASISSLDAIGVPEAARPIRSVPHIHHFRPLQILVQDSSRQSIPITIATPPTV
jgi:hypothetical protein